ncbi:hypothetical protein WKR88_25415 [Trinickia caryophylli]|uniref:Type IV pilus assembly protein PilN n=1 Tax=Trinickia caryophylli TaxID=28094 RepID=A0A1X7F4W5_TRICW|nr:hypothetical protein [Trinickia caryophylli]PMS08702.1 hypothetical protein C0Z17_28925 [Trinickia caryophylli]TRX19414.1 hypothetical protein FNF07_15080 [Trinickia caryophylli]WQE13279.1 hypothetical protein U0034_07870 [Trinickia caryophylli]SMF46032.1 type IV pilus assembly protein PilN [Trinickia caryophylli]GLU34400.1 hypothetical protein Busp01_42420 [Trinickia caryophylli]
MTARLLTNRDGCVTGLCLGGLNLLPYRQALKRGRGRRRLIECASAAAAGIAAAGAAIAWNAFGDAREAGPRSALAAQLRGLEPLLAERARLDAIETQARERDIFVARLAGPGRDLSALVDALSGEPSPGVALYRLHHTEAGVELRAGATDSTVAAGWIGRLARVPGVRAAEITDIRGARRSALPVDVVARLEWARVGASAAGAPPRATGARP